MPAPCQCRLFLFPKDNTMISQETAPEHFNVGDIISFRFPSSEQDDQLEKKRPCLVVDTDDETMLVAYGTSSRSRSNRGNEVSVRSRTDRAFCQLKRTTRFVGNRTVRVPLDSVRLARNKKGVSKIGRLPERLMPRLEHVRARLA